MREKLVPVEVAIRSATGLPADIFGLSDASRYAPLATDSGKTPTVDARTLARGYLKPGMAADVVVLDPESFIDHATFDEPSRYSSGVRHLWVNGVLTISHGHPTGALAGVALRHRPAESTPSNK
jgi:N-acyl-D-aspartate/D-glutamate deacylase